MTDFSAFPLRETRSYLWIKIPLAILAVVFVASFILLAQSTASGKQLGWTIFQTAAWMSIFGMAASLVAVFVWSIKKLVARFIALATSGPAGLDQPYDVIRNFEQFAVDNNYQFRQYPPQHAAPQEYYDGLLHKREKDDVYVLYQVTGAYEGADFTLYCLALSEGVSLFNARRQGAAYAYDSDGRRLEYVTVISTPQLVSRKRSGSIKAITTQAQSLIFCDGYVTDRKVITGMFAMMTESEAVRIS